MTLTEWTIVDYLHKGPWWKNRGEHVTCPCLSLSEISQTATLYPQRHFGTQHLSGVADDHGDHEWFRLFPGQRSTDYSLVARLLQQSERHDFGCVSRVSRFTSPNFAFNY